MTTMALPKHNITVTVPDGFSNHGNDDLFCLPATWYQIAIFFLVNYGSHALTIKSRPGQTYYHAARDVMCALLCPFSGVRRAIDSFGRSSWPSENHLIKAARAGALCIVVRNQEWQVTRNSHVADKTSEQQLAGATSIQEVQSGDSTNEPSNQRASATSIQKVQSGDSTDKPSKQQLTGTTSVEEVQSGNSTDNPSSHLASAISIPGVQNGNSPQAQFDEVNDRNSADQIELIEDAHRVKIVEETDPSPPGLSNDTKETPVDTVSKDHEKDIRALHNALVPVPSSSSSKATLLPAEAHRSYRHIHGMCKLPRGYSLTGLPSNAKIISDVGDEPGDTELCSSYNVPKAIIAIVQTIYASITLYRARGDQIQRYGYAAFGLTVLPYLIMSIMNLFATSLLPDYPSLYIVRSFELDEAITAGGQVDGAVGRIVQSTIENERFLTSNNKQDKEINPNEAFLSITYAHSEREIACYPPIPFEEVGAERWTLEGRMYSPFLIFYVFGTIPIAIIGIWTRFHAGKSTKAQRVWTMIWLVMDIYFGPWLDILSESDSLFPDMLSVKHAMRWYYVCLIALGTIPAIGGFVVVAQMLRAYGTCVEVSGVDS